MEFLLKKLINKKMTDKNPLFFFHIINYIKGYHRRYPPELFIKKSYIFIRFLKLFRLNIKSKWNVV